jgi:hypothetical protein
MRNRNPAAARFGQELREAMNRTDWTRDETGKNLGHVRAVLDGFPNSVKRPTQLDTVDEIAEAMGCRLSIVPIEHWVNGAAARQATVFAEDKDRIAAILRGGREFKQ